MKKISITVASAMSLLLAPSVMEAESKEKKESLYSTTQAPEIYGTKKATVHKSDKVSIIDPRYRVLAKDFEDGDLTDKIKLISIDGITNYQDKIDAKTGELKGLGVGTHTLEYQVTDSHGNTTKFTTTIQIENDSNDKEHSKDTIEKTIYSAPNSNRITDTMMKRGDEHDRQVLGVQLDPGQSIDIRISERPSNGGNLKVDAMTDGAKKDVYNQQINGNFSTLRAKTLDQTKGVKGNQDSTAVPLVVTPRNNYNQGSDARPYTVEYKVGHDVRRLPYYHTGDNQQQFFEFWKEENGAHNREVPRDNGKKQQRDTGYAVIEGQHHLMLVPGISRGNLEWKFQNGDNTLDKLNDTFIKLFKQYDTFVGLEENPKERINQRTYTKYYMRPDQNGLPGSGAYYVSPWIAQTSEELTWFSNMGWGTFHEIAHGYQGSNQRDAIDYMEVTNNVLAYYAQHNKDIAGSVDGYWMDMDRDVNWLQENRMNALKSRLPSSEGEIATGDLRWRLYSKGMDLKARLFFFVNMIQSLEPSNPSKPWGLYNESFRRERLSKSTLSTVPNHLLEAFYKEYGIDITPYLIEWGTSRPYNTKEHYDMQIKGDHMVQLRDVVYDKEELKKLSEELGIKEYGLARTSDLMKRNVQGKAKIQLKVSDDEFNKLKGKNILLYNEGKVVKEVPIGDSKDIEVDIPVGAYAVEFPKIYESGYTYSYEVPYVFSTDQEVDKKSKTSFPQYYTSYRLTKEEKKTLSKDSMVVLGTNDKNQEGAAFSITLDPREDRPTNETKISLNKQFKVKEKTEINIYTQLVAGTGQFVSRPDRTYTANKGEAFTAKKDRPISVADNDILEIKTTKDNFENVRNYSETGEEYAINRPKKETSYYRMTNRGFREVDIKPGELENYLYEQEKVKTIKELDEKIKDLPSDFYSSRHAYSPLKGEIITLYNKLKGDDQNPYKEIVEKIKQGGVPQITWKSAKSANEKLVVSDDKVNEVNWKDEISVIDPEDGRVPKEKIKISADTKRWTTPDEYKIHVEAEDMDGNKSGQELTVQVIPKKDFEEAHTKECEKQIENLDFLTDDEKSQAKEQLKKAYTATDLTEIVTKAKTKNDERTVQARNEVMTHLAEYKDLDASETVQIKDALDKCKTKEEMTKFHAKVKIDVEKRIQDAYNHTLKELEKCSKITKEEQEKVKEKLSAVQTRSEMENIISEVKKVNQERIDKVKTKLYDKLCQYKDLSQEEKSQIQEALNKETTEEKWQDIYNKAKKEIEQRIQDAYDNALKELKNCSKITNDEQDKVEEKLSSVQTRSEMENIISEVKKVNQERIDKVKTELYDKLCQYKDLSQEEKSQIQAALNKGTTEEKWQDIYNKAKKEIEQRIKDVYDRAVSDLAKYKEITDEEKITVKEKLEKTETRAEIEKIMDDVEKEDSARQLKDKDSIYENLCKYKDLSEEEKKEIKAALDKAKTREDLQRIREAVKAKVEARLQEEYAKATEALTQFSKLTAEEQAQATAALEQSETRKEMQEIVQKAKEENEKRTQKEDTDIKEEVEQIKDLSPQEKEEVLAAAEKLESKEELEALLAMVKEKIKQRVEEAYLLAQQQISVFGFLPKEKQESLQEKLKDVESRAEIEAIVKEAEKENQTQKEEEQQKVVEEIKNSTLTDKEKEEWIQKVEQAESKDDLDQIKETVDKVEEEQKDQWKEEKEQLIKELPYYSFITRNEKSTVKDAILASDSLETLEKIRTALQQTEAQRLAQGKLELKQSIEKEEALSKEAKAHFLAQVKEARTKEDLERIQSDVWKIVVDKEDQLRPLKGQVESWIEKNSFLTETEKSNAKRTLNALQSEEAVYHFAKELQEDAAKTRHQLEQQMRNEIQNLSYLSEKDKAHYAQLLTQAQDKRAMESILAQAKEMNRYYESSAFNQKQRELKARIQRLNLPKEEKDKWLQKVTNAKYLAELEMIEDHIQSAEKDYLEEQKQAVAKELASYQLIKEQRQSLMEKLKSAQTEAELQEIVNEAKSYHKENTKPKMHKEMQYLSFKKNTTILWNDVYLETQKGTAAPYLAQICKTKGYYIINGEKYWSVYNNKNKWLGYVKASEVETFQSPWQLQSQKSFKVKIAKKDYPIWKDLSLESKKGTTKSHYKKTYTVKRTYRHFNGKTYYSLYNIQTNKWTGYVDSAATKKVK